MITLGVNIFHADSSACIFIDEKLIAAAEEERFTRVKHDSNFPMNSIKFCLNQAKVNFEDIDYVTINSNPKLNIKKKILFLIKNPYSVVLGINSLINTSKKINILSHLKKLGKFNGKLEYIDHHLSHLASASYFSPFTKSVNVSVDGFGDFESCSWSCNNNNESLSIDGKIFFPHSLGIFYQAMTQYLGFKNYGDEYKVMGLSSYGKDNYYSKIKKLINYDLNGIFSLNLDYFSHHKKKIFKITDKGSPIFENLYSNNLINLLGKPRDKNEKITEEHINIAKSVQTIYEEALFNLLNFLYKKYEIENLTLSGGCAMNSVANGKILENTPFKNIYIPPNPGDAGGSIGSASVIVQKNNYKISNNFNYAYLGSSFDIDEVKEIISKKKLDKKFSVKFYSDVKDVIAKTCDHLCESHIIGWFQGKMEWGPRALGNRSIIADPRNKNIKEIINSKIKRRESFRPFAPSILREHVAQWFEIDKDVPFMSEVYSIQKDKRQIVPSITHVDGTGRLQTVKKSDNDSYYELINEFYKRTNVPLILNTSFNENEPIVRSPLEAIDCFERTNMDLLVVGNYVISR